MFLNGFLNFAKKDEKQTNAPSASTGAVAKTATVAAKATKGAATVVSKVEGGAAAAVNKTAAVVAKTSETGKKAATSLKETSNKLQKKSDDSKDLADAADEIGNATQAVADAAEQAAQQKPRKKAKKSANLTDEEFRKILDLFAAQSQRITMENVFSLIQKVMEPPKVEPGTRIETKSGKLLVVISDKPSQEDQEATASAINRFLLNPLLSELAKTYNVEIPLAGGGAMAILKAIADSIKKENLEPVKVWKCYITSQELSVSFADTSEVEDFFKNPPVELFQEHFEKSKAVSCFFFPIVDNNTYSFLSDLEVQTLQAIIREAFARGAQAMIEKCCRAMKLTEAPVANKTVLEDRVRFLFAPRQPDLQKKNIDGRVYGISKTPEGMKDSDLFRASVEVCRRLNNAIENEILIKGTKPEEAKKFISKIATSFLFEDVALHLERQENPELQSDDLD